MTDYDEFMTFSLFVHLCSQENQRKLFKEVVQFNPAKLQKGGGSGLGLYSELLLCITGL